MTGPAGPSAPSSAPVAAIAIGRNEGAQLMACLTSLRAQAARVIYVDSGSTDGSVAQAEALGAEVVPLDMDRPFTAARARNAGLAHLTGGTDGSGRPSIGQEATERGATGQEETGRGDAVPPYVQFVDADCELRPGWIATARACLDADPRIAVACGRRRERFPDASVWNAMIDDEWDTPVGPARACGGDALMRTAPLLAAGGFDPSLIAGEEPELCLRLRAAGWEIRRLDAEMTLHDAALLHFGQWWQRARRAGYTYAEGAAMHRRPPERHLVAELRRTLAWGLDLPLVTLAGLLATPWAALLLLVWPVQVVRLRRRGMPWSRAAFLTLGKLPEAQGALTWAWRRATRARARLIEYK